MTTLALDLQNIDKRYGRKHVLNGISHRFTPGLTLLVGPSGAGKSTLLRLVATAESPSNGTLLWNGKALPSAKQELRSTLGYAPQAVDLPEDITAREFASHMAALKGLDLATADQQFLALAETLGLHADIHGKISTFSGGMRRRLIFAQALLGAPQLIALDEPTAELDRDSARRVSELVLERAGHSIVVMTTHLAEELLPSAVAVLHVANGKIVAA